MAVTKQIYTATATWTAAQLADVYRDAFIDAGLMSAWYDSFLNTVENRVLEVTYNGAKTYGKTYYWFIFTTGGVFLSHASGWNATTHVPTGTALVDYFSTTTNATTNHKQLVSLSTGTTVRLVRYTSADSGGATWFALSGFAFSIDKPSITFPAWVDLDKVFHLGFYSCVSGSVGLRGASIMFASNGAFRRTVHGIGMQAVPNLSDFIAWTHQYAYLLPGKGNSSGWNFGNTHRDNMNHEFVAAVMLPCFTPTGNSAFSADQTPACTGLPISYYCSSSLPSDMAIIPDWVNSGMNTFDKLIIPSGGGEWEILHRYQSTLIGSTPSLILGARVL